MTEFNQKKIKAIINNFNILSWTKNLADFISKDKRIDVVIVDNNSTYQPLLDWYNICSYNIVRLKNNIGSHGGFCEAPKDNEMYIYTDPDLDLSNIPNDWLDLLIEGCTKYNAFKTGFSLEINDIPDDFILKESTVSWETNFWTPYIDKRFNLGTIDTTFSLVNPLGDKSIMFRTNRPYTAKHIPWYINETNISDEYKNYLNTINKNYTHYSKWFIDKNNSIKNKGKNNPSLFLGKWKSSLNIEIIFYESGDALWNNKNKGTWHYIENEIIRVNWDTGSVDDIRLKNNIMRNIYHGWTAIKIE